MATLYNSGIERDELHHRRVTFQVICSEIDRRERHYWTLRTCKAKMIANGWCYHKVEYLAKAARLDLFSYLSNLASLRQESHAPCRSRSTCVAHTVDPATYRTRHVREDCSCEHVATPYDDLLHVIRGGGIPLVSIVEVGGTIMLDVRKRSLRSKYVAVSHVWADGLGNSLKCSLPVCQLKRLSIAIARLAQSVYPRCSGEKTLFWMDTLCIPVEEEHLPLRRAQIDRMASIYYDAKACLVLDAELMSVTPRWVRSGSSQSRENEGAAQSAHPDFDLETYARIVCSVWQSRSWCLQEAVLPDRIAIHFSGCNIGLFELRDRKRGIETKQRSFGQRSWSKFEDWVLVQALISNSCDPMQSPTNACVEPLALPEGAVNVDPQHRNLTKLDLLRRFLQQNWWSNEGLAPVWNKLVSRSTSMSEDELLIVSNLMQFDSSHLFQYSAPEERFLAITMRCRNIPISLLSNTGPRCSLDGLRWIPTSISTELLQSKKQMWHINRRLHDKCVIFSYFGSQGDADISLYILEKESFSNLNSCIHFVDGPKTYFVEFAEDSSSSSQDREDGWGSSSSSSKKKKKMMMICVILERQEDWSKWPPVKRGSWFSVVKTEKRLSPLMTLPIFTLHFRGPLRFVQVRREISASCDEHHPRVEPLKRDVELKMTYKELISSILMAEQLEALSNVKKLGTLEDVMWNDAWFTLLGLVSILPAAAVAIPVVLFVWRRENHMSTGGIVGACLGFTAALWFGFFSVSLIIIRRYWNAPSAWFYTSSLSAIAR